MNIPSPLTLRDSRGNAFQGRPVSVFAYGTNTAVQGYTSAGATLAQPFTTVNGQLFKNGQRVWLPDTTTLLDAEYQSGGVLLRQPFAIGASSGGGGTELATHEADTTAVHGISDTSKIKGVVVHGATAGTARPTGFPSIEWIGSVAPTNAIDNDTWVNTA